MTPYEVYFYSSGAVEERWGIKELGLNNVTAIIGYALGGGLSFALMIVAAVLFLPQGISRVPRHAGARSRARARAGGPAAGARRHPLRRRRRGHRDVVRRRVQHRPVLRLAVGQEGAAAAASRFTLSWLVIFALAMLVVMTGYDPVKLTEYSVIFSVVALPLTYLPILLVARDERYMGEHVNGRLANTLGVFYLALLTVVSVVALPLLFATNHGSG